MGYEPAESTSGTFGGNSNWRGPVWFPMNFLLIESLRKFHCYFGDDFKIECPTGSGRWCTLEETAAELSYRLTDLFRRNTAGRRPVHGSHPLFQTDPHWRNLCLFYEYFHGGSGASLLGANPTRRAGRDWSGIDSRG